MYQAVTRSYNVSNWEFFMILVSFVNLRESV